MARILDAETEAFAPTVAPVERVKARTMDDDLRRLGLVAGVAKEALPLADLAARGGSTLYGGIKDWFAERDQEQKAEDAKVRGAKKYEDDFAAAETKPQPGPTAAVAGGAPATESYEDRQKRLGEMGLKDWLGKEEGDVAIPVAQRIAMERRAQMEAAKQAEETIQRHGNVLESIRLQDKLSEAKKREHELGHARLQAVQENRYWELPEFDQKLGEAGTATAAAQKQLSAFNAPASIPIGAGAKVFHDPRTGELRSVEPGYPTLGRGSLAYELEASRERPFQVGGKTVAAPSVTTEGEREPAKIAQAEAIMAEARRKSPGAVTPAGAHPEAWSAPATRTTVVEDPFKEGKQTIELAPPRKTGAALIDKYKAAAATEDAAKAEREAATTPKPAAPKTIGEATDDQLKMLKNRLESVAGRNLTEEQRQDLTGRLKDINDELDYRKTKDEPRTYSQWEALARVADTPEKQARVLELAKNVHMPAGGLADLLSPSAQLAERQAMGTRGEPGLFPPMAKRAGLIEIAKAAKYEAEANKINLSNPYEAAWFEAKINEKLANAGYTDIKASDVAALIAPKAEAMKELGHQRHEMADYYSARARAEDARARFRAAGRGGAGRDDMFKWGKEWNRVAEDQIRAAQKVATEAIDSAERSALKAQDSAQHASRLAEDVGRPPEPPKGLDKTNPKLVEQYQESLRKHKEREAAAAAAARAAAADRAFAEQKDEERRKAQTQLQDSLTAGDEARREFQTLYEERRGLPIGTPPAYKRPRPAAPPIKKEAPSPAPAKPPQEGDLKDMTLKNGSKVKAVFKNGEWVRAE